MSPYEREEQSIMDQLDSGQISNAEANRQLRELQCDLRDAARERAREAWLDAMDE